MGESRRELKHPRANHKRHAMVLGRERNVVHAHVGDDSAIRENRGTPDDNLIDTRHDCKNGGVGHNCSRDAGLRFMV
jgi:hypothetical protein